MNKSQQVIADCEKITYQFAKKILVDFFKEVDARLLEFADKARNNNQQWQLLEVSRHLKQKKVDMEVSFLEELKGGFRQFSAGKLGGQKSRRDDASANLSLIADDKLEIELAQNSFARRAETRFNEELYGIHQRLSMISGGKKIAEDGNPMGPTQFAKCLEQSLQELTQEVKIKVLIYKVFEKNMLLRLGELYGEINKNLVTAGVLPNLRYSVNKQADGDAAAGQTPVDHTPVVPRGVNSAAAQRTAYGPGGYASPVRGSPAHYVPVVPRQVAAQVRTPDSHQPSAQYQQQLYNAIRTMQKGIVRPQGWRMNNAPAASSNELVSVIDHVQSVAAVGVDRLDDQHIVPCETVSDAGAVSQRLQQEVNKETGKNIDEEKANTIDLVGMIFEYMLGDDSLPDNVKAVLSYLHTPYLKIAFLDEELFAKPEHPARQLLNALEETGTKWVNQDGSSQFKAFPKIKGVVRRVLMEFHKDLSLVEELLADLREFNEKVQRNVDLLEQRATQKAEGEDRLKQVKKQVHHTVKERIDGKKLPSPVIVLLLHPWSEYLTFVLLRHGERSEPWQQALQTIDDVLWSVTPKSTAEEKNKLMKMQEPLQDALKHGFNSIAYDAAKANKLLDAIREIHHISLQNRATQAAPAAVRDEIESTAVGHEEAHAVQLQPQTPEERELVEKLRMVEFGTWMEFDDLDNQRNQRVKIAWFNSKTLQYMLVNRAGKQAAVLSAVEIARHMLSKNARMISGTAKPFFERALENIFARLQANAA